MSDKAPTEKALYQRQLRRLMREREKRLKGLRLPVSAAYVQETQRVAPKFCDACGAQLGSIIYVKRSPTRRLHKECY